MYDPRLEGAGALLCHVVRHAPQPSSKELFGTCPYFTSQKVLASTWLLFIIHRLTEHESVRFNELLRLMPDDMTHPVLSRQLKALVEALGVWGDKYIAYRCESEVTGDETLTRV